MTESISSTDVLSWVRKLSHEKLDRPRRELADAIATEFDSEELGWALAAAYAMVRHD